MNEPAGLRCLPPPQPPPPLPGQSKWTFCLGSELVLPHPLGTMLKLLRFSWLLLRGLFTSAAPPIALQEGGRGNILYLLLVGVR